MSDALSLREEQFVAAFLANGGDATNAAIAAGYSKKTAYAKGHDVKNRPRVAAAIAAAAAVVKRKFNLSGERVMKEMCAIAFSDIRHYAIDDDGNVTLAQGAPDSAMRAIKKLKRKVRFLPTGKDAPPIKEVETEIELWSKDNNLVSLGRTKHLKLFTEAERDEGILALGEAMRLAEQRLAAERGGEAIVVDSLPGVMAPVAISS